MAGPPDVLDEEQAFKNPDDPKIRADLEAQAAALLGHKGSQILAVSVADGKTLAAYELGAMPTFDGMAAAKGKLYLTTVDGKIMCLGSRGSNLLPVGHTKLTSLDVSVKPVADEPEPAAESPPAAPAGPSLKGDFAKVVQAQVTKSELGYHLHADGKKMAIALKKLPAPLTGKVELKVRMKVARDGALKNCFLAFGDNPEEANLVKCGLRFSMKKAVIVQGSLSGGKAAEQAIELNESKVYDLDVTVDLPSGQVTMKTDETTVTAILEKRPVTISYLGYATTNASADFSAVEISAK
jgi:hypothetical protein